MDQYHGPPLPTPFSSTETLCESSIFSTPTFKRDFWNCRQVIVAENTMINFSVADQAILVEAQFFHPNFRPTPGH